MKHSDRWVLLTLVLAALPSFIHLPLWTAGVALGGCLLHLAGRWRRGWPGRFVMLGLLAGTLAGIWFSFESWFSGDAVLSFFVAVVFLKWGEAQGRRDSLLLIFAAVVLAAVGALYFESVLNLLHMLVVILVLTMSLIALHVEGSGLRPVVLLGRAVWLVGLALPLTLLLFLCCPRIPGPLWDIGLAFGLPVKVLTDRGGSELGRTRVLEPGGIQRAREDNGNVLVAEFEGAVPFKSRLYWRGPVFWHYDGEKWHMEKGWGDNRDRLKKTSIRSREQLHRELRHRESPVRYSLRVMPNGNRWLYGLDVPAAAAPESMITREFQLVSVRTIDDQEPKIEMLSYLDYGFGPKLAEEQRVWALAWPGESDPRLRALGQSLAKEQGGDPGEIETAIYRLLAAGGYSIDKGHTLPPGENGLDRFFFDEKRGDVEYLAGSVAMLLRAAGVPARLVGGFRGGSIIALTNFVIVKQSDAHVWVEAWSEARGWHRVEALDIVSPMPGDRAQTAQTKPAAQARTVAAPAKQAKQPGGQAASAQASGQPPSPPSGGTGKAAGPDWHLPDWASLLGAMQKWVINYNPDRQVELLKGAGMAESGWGDLLILGGGGLAGLLLLYGLIAWWRNRESVDQVARSWRDFCRRMAKQGVKKLDWECPRHFLDRICQERPEFGPAAQDIIQRYIGIRYSRCSDADAGQNFQRQVQRFLSMT